MSAWWFSGESRLGNKAVDSPRWISPHFFRRIDSGQEESFEESRPEDQEVVEEEQEGERLAFALAAR